MYGSINELSETNNSETKNSSLIIQAIIGLPMALLMLMQVIYPSTLVGAVHIAQCHRWAY